MGCLTDVEVQAIVDDEATDASSEHVLTCVSCQRRIDERRGQMRAITEAIGAAGDVPSGLEARLRHAMTSDQVVRGATVLRGSRSSSWFRSGWLSAAATAAVVALIIFFVLPKFGAPTQLSASQVLERSLQTLSKTTGVEALEYELSVEGVSGGPFRITQLIDRANPNHYRIASYGADGALQTAISQDPDRKERTQVIQVDGRNYVVKVPGIRQPVLSLPQMGQALLESVIGMMQATSDPTLTEQDTANGRVYIVETPQGQARGGATLDLYHARAVISADDFRVRQFEGSGSLLRQPFSVSFTLITQRVLDASLADFAIEPGSDDVVLNGVPGDGPIEELLATIVREMGRQGAR